MWRARAGDCVIWRSGPVILVERDWEVCLVDVSGLFCDASPNSGGGRCPNFEEEVLVITEAVGHPFEGLD